MNDSPAGAGRAGTANVSCGRCGRVRDERTPAAEALAWAFERDGDGRGGARWLCPDCARAHARDIEGRLPDEYW